MRALYGMVKFAAHPFKISQNFFSPSGDQVPSKATEG
jgi:hypothetical protein